jgi:hypothetical protein
MPEELTDRIIAIAQGEDPDAIDSVATEPEVETPESASAETPVVEQESPASEEQSGKDSQSSQRAAEAEGNSAGSTWLNDEIKQLGKSYDLSDEDMRSFKDEAAFRSAARLFDKQLTKPKQDAAAGQPEKKPEQAASPEVKQDDEIELDPEAWKKDGYGEREVALVKYAKKLRDENGVTKAELGALKPQIQQMYDAYQMQKRAQHFNQFHNEVDGFSDDRFGATLAKDGRPNQITPEQDKARARLYEAADTIARGIVERAKSAGKNPEVPSMKVLLQRAYNMEFGTDIAAETKKKQSEAIAKQSRTRRPVDRTRHAESPRKAKNEPQSLDELAKAIAGDPEVDLAYKKLAGSNG